MPAAADTHSVTSYLHAHNTNTTLVTTMAQPLHFLSCFALPQVKPRVNSCLPPAQPVVHEDRSRLLLRLDQYDLIEREVKGDGACQVGHHTFAVVFCLQLALPYLGLRVSW